MKKTFGLVCFLFLLSSPVSAQTPSTNQNGARTYPDFALQPPPVNTSPGSEYASWTRMYQAIPGIEHAPNGRLWAVWTAGDTDEGPSNYVLLVTSTDDGKSWSEPKLVIDPPGNVHAWLPCLWIDPLGRLWLFWSQDYGRWDGRGGVWAIVTQNPDSENPAWSKPRRLADGRAINKPTVLTSREWLLPVAVKPDEECDVAEINHDYKLGLTPLVVKVLCHDLGGQKGTHVYSSRDNGETWKSLSQALVQDTDVGEHMIVERHDGSLWMLVRTQYGIGQSISRDRGKTWGESGPSGIRNAVSRFFVRRLNSGKLLIVRHNPPDIWTRSMLVAYLSDDDGKTWYGGLLLDERKGVSYPDGVEAGNGKIYVIYDRGRETDQEILMATFTEEDVKQEKCVTDQCQLKMIVNKADNHEAAEPEAQAGKTYPGFALQPPLINTSPGPEYASWTRMYQGIPGIERTANGRLWAAWVAGDVDEGPGRYVVLVTSADDGKAWSEPKLVIDPPGNVAAWDPCLWTDPRRRLWLFWRQGYGDWDGRNGVWTIVSEDPDSENPRWSKPRRLADGIAINKPTVLMTGEWLLPVAVLPDDCDIADINKDYKLGLTPSVVKMVCHDLSNGKGSNVYVSHDQGATWGLLGQARVQDYCCEHMIVERRDKSLWMLVRTEYGIGQSISRDGGKSWNESGPSGIRNAVSRFFIRRLKSGKLMIVRHNPPDLWTRSMLTAYLSDNDGKTWYGGLVLDERRGVSYPDGVEGNNGKIYVIYDRGRTTDHEILMATFTEGDVKQSKCVTDQCQLKMIVNKAGE